MESKYTIEVSDEAVEITGTLTIREAFDFLSFFEKEGFTTLEDWGERTTLYLRKRNLDQEITDRVNKNVLDELTEANRYGKELIAKNVELTQKIKDLEYLIKKITLEEGEKYSALKKAKESLEKFKILQQLKDSPEAAEICKVQSPEGEEADGQY
jgi:hypothetical protein